MKGLEGKAAIVNGGGSGIGKAIARRFGAEGCNVGVLDRNADAADDTARSLRAEGAKAHAYAVDITDLAAVRTAVQAIETDTPLLRSFADEGEPDAMLIEGLMRAIPMRRLGQPDDYAGIFALLASEDAGFITGQTLSVSGGLTMHG